NEVFYDEVRIPLSNVVGEIDDGWQVAMCTLSLERGQSFIARQIALAHKVRKLIDLARATPSAHGIGMAIDDGDFAQRLATLQSEVSALKSMTYIAVSQAQHQEMPGPEGSMIALYYSELAQRVFRMSMEVMGPAGMEIRSHDDWNWEFLNSFKFTITGGTAQIRRNIIGERVLGLPRK
ncbi:MAG: acyl-CoA dehydrogenase family protein, partial [Gammaproteobacteria bacterium]|nr:acyl-CoA dehydrogenase family protein [Gammaproteobacteria bacterium]